MKSVISKNDLAINGAPPAFSSPVHVGRPNIGNQEKFMAYAESIFENRWLSNNGPLLRELETKIADYHQVKHCIAMCNGVFREPNRRRKAQWQSSATPQSPSCSLSPCVCASWVR